MFIPKKPQARGLPLQDTTGFDGSRLRFDDDGRVFMVPQSRNRTTDSWTGPELGPNLGNQLHSSPFFFNFIWYEKAHAVTRVVQITHGFKDQEKNSKDRWPLSCILQLESE